MTTDRARRWTVALGFALTAGATAAQTTYRGLCDASAAEALGAHHVVVGDDESETLRIYERDKALPVGTVELTDYLHNRKPGGKEAEADIEGAATIGARIYWITSHARKGKGDEADPFRQRLFATDIDTAGPVPTVKAVGIPYASLLEDLFADPRFSLLIGASQRKLEQKGGLNIEGLAATAEGGLLIGFRNPLAKGKALIVPLRNPREVIDGGAKPLFGDLIRLDLGGRGIRSIERVSDELLISAGPYGTAAASRIRPAFALYRWSGQAAQAPLFVRSLEEGSFRAEALFVDAEANQLVLLSDDGDEPVGGVDCKAKSVPPERKSFRSRTLPMPLPLTGSR